MNTFLKKESNYNFSSAEHRAISAPFKDCIIIIRLTETTVVTNYSGYRSEAHKQL